MSTWAKESDMEDIVTAAIEDYGSNGGNAPTILKAKMSVIKQIITDMNLDVYRGGWHIYTWEGEMKLVPTDSLYLESHDCETIKWQDGLDNCFELGRVHGDETTYCTNTKLYLINKDFNYSGSGGTTTVKKETLYGIDRSKDNGWSSIGMYKREHFTPEAFLNTMEMIHNQPVQPPTLIMPSTVLGGIPVIASEHVGDTPILIDTSKMGNKPIIFENPDGSRQMIDSEITGLEKVDILPCMPQETEKYIKEMQNKAIHSVKMSIKDWEQTVKEEGQSYIQCECGSDKAGGGNHSDWCPKWRKEL